MDADSYRRAQTTDEQTARHDEVYGALARSTRELVAAQLLTEVDPDVAREAIAEIDALTARLRKQARTTPLGIEVGEDGATRAHGNAVIGLRNPVAPPLHIERT